MYTEHVECTVWMRVREIERNVGRGGAREKKTAERGTLPGEGRAGEAEPEGRLVVGLHASGGSVVQFMKAKPRESHGSVDSTCSDSTCMYVQPVFLRDMHPKQWYNLY